MADVTDTDFGGWKVRSKLVTGGLFPSEDSWP
jgi:hypothetical protein